MTAEEKVKRALLGPGFQKKAFALFDALSDAGLTESEIGAALLGMAASALHSGGKTCAQVHEMIDKVWAERGSQLS